MPKVVSLYRPGKDGGGGLWSGLGRGRRHRRGRGRRYSRGRGDGVLRRRGGRRAVHEARVHRRGPGRGGDGDLGGVRHGGVRLIRGERGKEIIARNSYCGDAEEQDYVEALALQKVAHSFQEWFFHAV